MPTPCTVFRVNTKNVTSVDSIGGWSEVLARVVSGDNLSSEDCRSAMTEILSGSATDAQLAALLVALRMKGETSEELVGLATAMLDAAEPLSLPPKTVDIVGTGGSSRRRRHALNVSTMASIVVAAAGVKVCKHGNKKASSTSGSFDFLEALGVGIQITPDQLEGCLRKVGVGFAFARTFHPAMRLVGPTRTQLGIPTVFNILGPLVHPGRPEYQLIGTSSVELGAKMAKAVQSLGVSRAWVITGSGGYDELTLTGQSHIWDVGPDEIIERTVTSEDAGLEPIDSIDMLAGGNGEENVQIFADIVSGEDAGPKRDIVVYNAAAALVIAGKAESLVDGASMALEVIESGQVADKVDHLRRCTVRSG